MPHLCEMPVKVVVGAIFYRALHLYEMPVHRSPQLRIENYFLHYQLLIASQTQHE
jgi:hypothetical protein